MDTNLKSVLHKMAEQFEPSPLIKDAVMEKVSNVSHKPKMKAKFKVLIAVAVVAFSIPLFAFVKQFMYADQLYGSYAALKNEGLPTTIESYERLDVKLGEAYDELGSSWLQFIGQIKDIVQFKLKYGDTNGNVNAEKLTAEQYAKYFTLLYEVQPHMDKLNGFQPANLVLTEAEYYDYIEALIQLQSIIVISNEGFEDYSYNRIHPDYADLKAQMSLIVEETEQKIRKTVNH